MKRARVNDFRRRLREKARSWPLQIKRIAFSSVQTLGEGEIPLMSPLSVICGPNGVGKTTLLKLIWATLDPANMRPPKFGAFQAGSATIDLSDGANQIELTSDFGAKTNTGSLDAEVVYINTSVDVDLLQGHFADTSLEHVINGIGAKTLTTTELQQINSLTLRNYREVTLYEVELAKGIVPFFEVSYGSSRYDSRSMGSGEFAAFSLWWELQRARPKSILLIEEPECFLSPGSQAAFTDFLTQVIVNKKLCAIVTSHSAEIITPLPQESIRFIRRDDAGIRFGTERPSPLLLETIGVRIPIDILVLVEDRAAERLCRRLVEHFDPFLARRMEIVPQDGDGSIINILREVENHYQSLTILGLFDGDVRDSLPNDIRPKALFLPGNRPIERLFKDMCESDQVRFEDFSGLKNVGETLFALESRDHHDWFIEFAKSRGLELGQLFMLLFRFWFQIEDNEREAQSIFEAIRMKVDPDSAKTRSRAERGGNSYCS